MADSPQPYSPSTERRSRQDSDGTTTGNRMGAKALFSSDGEMLLIKEGRDDGSSFWTLPGGGVSPGESLEESLHREIMEEIQCAASCGEPVGTCAYEHTTFGDVTTVYTVFDCRLDTKPTPNTDEDILAVDWVAPEDLPNDLLDPFAELIRDLSRDEYF